MATKVQPFSDMPVADMPNEEKIVIPTRKEAKLKKKKGILDAQIDDLEKEVEHMRKIIEDEERYTSASRDARKMYGDITPGDQTHQDVILLYQNHFKSAQRNMPREFPSEDKFKIWQLCAAIVQESFDANKEKIIRKMNKDLKNSLDLKNSKDGQLPEDTRDLHRAFKMMISKMDKDQTDKDRTEFKKKVLNDLEHRDHTDEEMFDFVMNVILKLDPADYESFFRTGKIRNMEDLEDSNKPVSV